MSSSSAVDSLCDSLQSLWVADPLMSAINNGMSWSDVPGVIDYKVDMDRFKTLCQNEASKPAEPKCPIYRTPNARDFEPVDLPCPPPAERIPYDTHAEKRSWIEGVDFVYDSEDDEDDYDSDDDYEYVSIGEAMVWKSAPIRDYDDAPSKPADTIVVDISIRTETAVPSKPQATASKPQTTYKPEIIVPPISVGIKTLIARNLPRDITVQKLRDVFEKYGPIKDVYIPKNMDRSSPYFGTTKGFALIKFLNAEHSAKAFTSEYGRLAIGRNNISLEFAKEDR